VDLAAEQKRIKTEIVNIDNQVTRIEGKLNNAGFTSKAPAQVVERERSKLSELQTKRVQMLESLAELSEM